MTTQRMVTSAIESRLRGMRPLVIGDMKSNLDFHWDRQEEILSADMDAHNLVCATQFFRHGDGARPGGD